MTVAEHYFEHILYTYKHTGEWDKSITDKLLTDDLSVTEVNTIQMCALYIIDNICEWKQENVTKLLSHTLFD